VSYYYCILFFNPSLVLFICVFLLTLFFWSTVSSEATIMNASSVISQKAIEYKKMGGGGGRGDDGGRRQKIGPGGRPRRAQDLAPECGVENIGGEGTEGDMACGGEHHTPQSEG
jgi:hypothetical protein